MQLTQDQKLKILELLQYAEYLPGRPVKDIITLNKVFYSPTIAELLSQDLSDRQIREIEMYIARVDKLDQKENDVIDRMAFRSAGRGDVEIDPSEPINLRQSRELCIDRIRNILGLPDKWVYFAEHR